MSESPNVAAQMAKIREEVNGRGKSFVSCENLVLLCDGAVEEPRQLVIVARIAAWEGWTFDVADGGVCFRRRPE